MFNIPNKVKVGANEYSIEYPEQIVYRGETVDGLISHAESKIKILASSKGTWRDYTFMHEIVHALLENAGLENTEDICDRLARQLHAFLLDNPNIFNVEHETKQELDVKCVENQLEQDLYVNRTEV